MATQWQITDEAENEHILIMIASTTTAVPTEKLEERTTTCNVAHEQELWRRKGGRDEHLRASFYTCTAASPLQKIQRCGCLCYRRHRIVLILK